MRNIYHVILSLVEDVVGGVVKLHSLPSIDDVSLVPFLQRAHSDLNSGSCSVEVCQSLHLPPGKELACLPPLGLVLNVSSPLILQLAFIVKW